MCAVAVRCVFFALSVYTYCLPACLPAAWLLCCVTRRDAVMLCVLGSLALLCRRCRSALSVPIHVVLYCSVMYLSVVLPPSLLVRLSVCPSLALTSECRTYTSHQPAQYYFSICMAYICSYYCIAVLVKYSVRQLVRAPRRGAEELFYVRTVGSLHHSTFLRYSTVPGTRTCI
jgi:hypothetical protein